MIYTTDITILYLATENTVANKNQHDVRATHDRKVWYDTVKYKMISRILVWHGIIIIPISQ